jgi:predicted transcriptional regulator
MLESIEFIYNLIKSNQGCSTDDLCKWSRLPMEKTSLHLRSLEVSNLVVFNKKNGWKVIN